MGGGVVALEEGFSLGADKRGLFQLGACAPWVYFCLFPHRNRGYNGGLTVVIVGFLATCCGKAGQAQWWGVVRTLNRYARITHRFSVKAELWLPRGARGCWGFKFDLLSSSYRQTQLLIPKKSSKKPLSVSVVSVLFVTPLHLKYNHCIFSLD